MKLQFGTARVGIERLESRTLYAAVNGWTVLSTVPQAKGLKSNLSLNSYQPLSLNGDSIANSLSKAPKENVVYGTGRGTNSRLISMPTPDGGYQRFRIVESTVLSGADQKTFGKVIRTFAGVGVDDPSASIRLDYTPLGFHAQVLTHSGDGAYYIDPLYTGKQGAYASYYASDVKPRAGGPSEDDIAESAADSASATASRTSAGTSGTTVSLRTYRAAVATTGEYAAAVCSLNGVSLTAANTLAAVTTSVNRVRGIYETEMAISLTLVGNESSLIYTNASTDPYSNSTTASNYSSVLLTNNQTNIDSVVGNANYDIGHVFSTAGGGLAGLGVVGVSGQKAQGETGTSSPVGDAFDVDYVAHEMGHQFGANHTFNTANDTGNRNAGTAFEPGSGSTIMAYAGLENDSANSIFDDLQPNSDPYFAFVSLNEILQYVDVTRGTGTGTRTVTTNNIPSATFTTTSYTIPANTPFTLTSPTATDANADAVYYSWEEADAGAARYLSQADNGSSALFRVYNPTTSPSRTFPQLASVLAGQTYTATSAGSTYKAEQLPTTSRTMKFVLTLRDKKAGAGGTNVLSGTGSGTTTASITPTVSVTSVAAASSFAISNFNTATTVAGGSSQAITWNVAGTTASGINTANVQILMSTDNGTTFPYTLAASTTNDGTESVTLPTGLTSSNVRFKVAAVGNIYFDINNAALTITPGVAAVSATPGVPDLVAATDTGVSTTDNITNRNNSAAAKNLQFTVSGTVSGATVTIQGSGAVLGSAVATGTTTTVTTNGTATLLEGVNNISAVQTEPGKTVSTASAALPVTIDTVAPTFTASPVFQFATNKPRVVYAASETIAQYGALPTVTRNNPSPAILSPNVSSIGTNTFVDFSSSPNGILPNGDYTIAAAANTFFDTAGNSIAVASTFNFFYVAGDANRDRKTDFNDFLILQNNFGANVLDYTAGDFNYDGKVDFNDFLILQNNFGVAV